MASAFTAYQAFLRRVLQDNEGNWETDCELVRRKVTHIANEKFDTRLDGESTLLSSSIEGVAFSYRIDGKFDQDALLEHATRALAAIEAINPKDIRAGWDSLTTVQKATLNGRAIKRLRLTLRRCRRTKSNFVQIPL